MVGLCAYLNYSWHRIEFSVGLSYLSMHRLQVNVYCKEWWWALVSLGQTTIFMQGAYTEGYNVPCTKIAVWLWEHPQCRFVKIVSTNFLFIHSWNCSPWKRHPMICKVYKIWLPCFTCCWRIYQSTFHQWVFLVKSLTQASKCACRCIPALCLT